LAAPPKRGSAEHKGISFLESIEGKKFKSPKSGRMVKFTSLPPEERRKIRGIHSKHYKAADSHHGATKKLFDNWHGKKYTPKAAIHKKKPTSDGFRWTTLQIK